MQLAWPAGPPRRIVFLHLDSLCCLPALDYLFSSLGNRIGLVISSDRFARNSGGGFGQLLRALFFFWGGACPCFWFFLFFLPLAAPFFSPPRPSFFFPVSPFLSQP